jgi:hypothetical protein
LLFIPGVDLFDGEHACLLGKYKYSYQVYNTYLFGGYGKSGLKDDLIFSPLRGRSTQKIKVIFYVLCEFGGEVPEQAHKPAIPGAIMDDTNCAKLCDNNNNIPLW